MESLSMFFKPKRAKKYIDSPLLTIRRDNVLNWTLNYVEKKTSEAGSQQEINIKIFLRKLAKIK